MMNEMNAMFSKIIAIVGIVLVALIPAMGLGATISIPSRDYPTLILFRGPIQQGDAVKLEQTLKPFKFENVRPTLVIDSDGGSILEAMTIGHLLRDRDAIVAVVDDHAKCESSCVFILMGGATRVISKGRVGVHRPYLQQAEVGQDFEQSYRTLHNSLEQYFDEMHISKELLDLMYSVPPEQMRSLTRAEINLYLPEDDPVFDEKRAAIGARELGLTSVEYRIRRAQSFKCFALVNKVPAEKLDACVRAALLGISEDEFLVRKTLAQKICVAGALKRSQFGISEKLSAHDCVLQILKNGI